MYDNLLISVTGNKFLKFDIIALANLVPDNWKLFTYIYTSTVVSREIGNFFLDDRKKKFPSHRHRRIITICPFEVSDHIYVLIRRKNKNIEKWRKIGRKKKKTISD